VFPVIEDRISKGKDHFMLAQDREATELGHSVMVAIAANDFGTASPQRTLAQVTLFQK
jgi:hypothetical protein